MSYTGCVAVLALSLLSVPAERDRVSIDSDLRPCEFRLQVRLAPQAEEPDENDEEDQVCGGVDEEGSSPP